MQLSGLKSAWEQLKLSNAMHNIERQEILAIIEHPEASNKGKLQRVFFNVIMFAVLIIVCKSG